MIPSLNEIAVWLKIEEKHCNKNGVAVTIGVIGI